MAIDIIKLQLSSREAEYLASAAFLMPHQVATVCQGEVSKSGLILILPRDQAEEFREAFTEQLAKVGFDERYEATPEGQLLEELIDRFFGN